MRKILFIIMFSLLIPARATAVEFELSDVISKARETCIANKTDTAEKKVCENNKEIKDKDTPKKDECSDVETKAETDKKN